MESLLLSAALFVFASTALAQDELPSDARDLVDKLAIFSKEAREKVEGEIRVKESQVAQILGTHLQAQTKAGNLNGALAIQKVIYELSPEKPSEDEKMVASAESVTETGNELDFLDHVWSADGGKIGTYQFLSDGTGFKGFRGVPRPITWTLNDGGLVVAKTPIGEEIFHFGRRAAECYAIAADGKTRVPMEKIEKARK